MPAAAGSVRCFLFPVLLLSVCQFRLFTEETANTQSTLAQLQVQMASHDKDINQLKEQMNSVTAIRGKSVHHPFPDLGLLQGTAVFARPFR